MCNVCCLEFMSRLTVHDVFLTSFSPNKNGRRQFIRMRGTDESTIGYVGIKEKKDEEDADVKIE